MEVFEVYTDVFHKAIAFDPMEALRDPVKLRRLLNNYAEDKEKLLLENKAMLPTVKAFEKIADLKGSLCITDTAKVLQVRPGFLFTILSNKTLSNGKWIYRRGGSGPWRGYQDKCDDDLLTHKVWILDGDTPKQREREGVRVTKKGLALLAKLIEEEQPSDF